MLLVFGELETGGGKDLEEDLIDVVRLFAEAVNELDYRAAEHLDVGPEDRKRGRKQSGDKDVWGVEWGGCSGSLPGGDVDG